MAAFGASGPVPRFDSSEPTHLADAGLIRVPPGGWERNIFLPNRCHSIRRLLGLPGPDPGHFLLVQKVTKNTFKGGGCSDSPSPLKNPSTHNGFSRGRRPLAKGATPLAWLGVRQKRPRRGRSEANQRSVCRGRRRRSGASEACRLRRDEGCGACADACPPLCRRGGGVHRGGTPSKGSLSYAVFWLLFVRTKSDPGLGRGGPGATE